MESHFQSAPLLASPSYPNSVSWSEENLVAVASGHIITILNPASLAGPRGLIKLPPIEPFPIGVVKSEDLLTGSLMPICLSRDTRPCARSISWSPLGLAPHSGCLLAVCTTDGHVKLYRSPYCEYRSEWVEVVDISDMLCDYFLSTNFRGSMLSLDKFNQEQTSEDYIVELEHAINISNSIPSKGPKSKRFKASSIISGSKEILEEKLPCGGKRNLFPEGMLQDINSGCETGTPSNQSLSTTADVAISQCSILKKRSLAEEERPSAKERKDECLPLITAEQYASRNALLSSLVVAWSSLLHSSSGSYLSSNCVILAVGGKSGKISFWRIHQPQYYTIEHGKDPVNATLVGFLQAHNSWVTAIDWEIYVTKSSKSHLVLATGSSDGSVKIWLADAEVLINSSNVNSSSFALLKEVIAITSVPISTLAMVTPIKSDEKIVLAIGKGCGSLEVWICHMSSNKFQSAGVYNAHDQVVTGLSWAFDGRCLFSCSQDGSVRSWPLAVPTELSTPLLKDYGNVAQVSDPCFGLTPSRGNMVLAVVRSFDVDLLNQMYQARTQKAAVEFFWIGGQQLDIPSGNHLDSRIGDSHGLSKDLMCWESNILWSLNRYDNVDKQLVLWDVLAALLAFKKTAPSFVEHLLLKWLSSRILGSHSGISVENILFHVRNSLSMMNSRWMHLFNIFCRQLMLTVVKADGPNGKNQSLDGANSSEEEQTSFWNKLLVESERELQQRLVAFAFKAALSAASCTDEVLPSGTLQLPFGVAQMEQWVSINKKLVSKKLVSLGSKIRELGSRVHTISDYVVEENCIFCSAPVPFESPEFALCKGAKKKRSTAAHGSSKKSCHEVTRCAVSMQLCPMNTPLWFCMCCHRWVAKLVPQSFFISSDSPSDDISRYVVEHSHLFRCPSKPLCPFCGTLLQRSLPDFLLSVSPV